MIKILWVDRQPGCIYEYLEISQLNDIYSAKYFDCYSKALQYAINNSDLIDLIISNYSTLTWTKYFGSGSSELKSKTGFDFYDDLQKNNITAPFVLHTSMNDIDDIDDIDKTSHKYSKLGNFTLIPKFPFESLLHYLTENKSTF